MTPAARVQAAIEVVDSWLAASEGLDRVLTRWGRANRFAGSGDRHAIADLVYGAVRRMRSAAWTASVPEPADGRALLRGSLILDGADPGAVFTGERHAPARLRPEETAGVQPLSQAPRPVRLDFPDWLAPELAGIDDQVLDALRSRAPLDLRLNTLKADRAHALAVLAEDGIAAEPVPLSATALRVRDGQRRVAASRAYRAGLVEVQDAASQAAADLAEARPGESVLDLCAGGGGKTLALAAAMQRRGRLVAHDIAPQRIAALPERAARAGAAVEIVDAAGLAQMEGTFDLVFVDAPCSGSGAWRRNPDGKWRLAPQDLSGLTGTQSGLLDRAARLVRPGGRIAYVTCSILPRENDARVTDFLSRSPGWRLARRRALTPLDGGDGFFAAILDNRSKVRKN